MTTMFEDSASTLNRLKSASAFLQGFTNDFQTLHGEIMEFARKGAASVIAPPLHIYTPKPVTQEQSALMLSTLKLGGYVFANLNNNNETKMAGYTTIPRWVVITDMSIEENAAVMAEPWWSAIHKPLKRYKQAIWEFVILAKSGA